MRRTRVLQGRGGGGGDAVDAAGDPVIEVVFIRKAADAQGRIVACFHRKGLALSKRRRVLIVQNGTAAFISFDSAGVVVIIKAESASAVRLNGKVAARDAEVVSARRIHIEGSAPLSKYEARCPRGIVQGKVVELQNRVFFEESHCAVLEFHFGAAVVRGKNVSLPDRQVKPTGLPCRFGVCQRIAMTPPDA